MPALSHLLSVGEGRRVLCLEVDERFVYAGCQGRDNEIVVSLRVGRPCSVGVELPANP
jgi:hypothetical protein